MTKRILLGFAFSLTMLAIYNAFVVAPKQAELNWWIKVADIHRDLSMKWQEAATGCLKDNDYMKRQCNLAAIWYSDRIDSCQKLLEHYER